MGDADQAAIGRTWKINLPRNFWPMAHQVVGWGLFIWSFICFYGATDNVAWRWLLFLGWPGVIWIAVVVHELGHAAAAVAAGWRVVAIAMGPIAFHLWNRDFAIVPRSKRSEIEGFVLPLPADAAVFTIPRKLLISAGGPAANIVLAMMLFAAALAPAEATFCGQLSPVPGGFAGELPENIDLSGCFSTGVDWSLIMFGAALVSLSLGIGSLMPAGPDKRDNDGDHLLAMMRLSQAEWLKYRAYSYLRMLTGHQTRLRDLPHWLVGEASMVAEQEGGALRQAQDALLIGMVLDSAPVDVTQARSMLDAHRERYDPSEWLDSCDAYFSAIWENDAPKARALLWRGEGDPEMKALALAAEAAVLAREGDAAASKALIDQMHVANRERSIFPDHTFRDIGGQIRAILPA